MSRSCTSTRLHQRTIWAQTPRRHIPNLRNPNHSLPFPNNQSQRCRDPRAAPTQNVTNLQRGKGVAHSLTITGGDWSATPGSVWQFGGKNWHSRAPPAQPILIIRVESLERDDLMLSSFSSILLCDFLTRYGKHEAAKQSDERRSQMFFKCSLSSEHLRCKEGPPSME